MTSQLCITGDTHFSRFLINIFSINIPVIFMRTKFDLANEKTI